MNQYPDYKQTGLQWLPEVPEHWQVKRLKYVLKGGKEGIRIGPFGSSLKADVLTPSGYKVYGQENIINNDFDLGWRYIGDEKFAELEDYQIIPGDALVTMMGTTGKCKVVPSQIEPGIMDSHLIRLRVDTELVLPHFTALLINNAHYLFTQMKLMSKGSIMEGLNSTTVKNLLVAVPPLSEQITIKEYLDTAIARIDTVIAAKTDMIRLLREERTAFISNAVSGEGKNWGRKKLSHGVQQIGSGTTPKSGEGDYYNGTINWLQTGDLNDGVITRTSKQITAKALEDYSTLRMYPEGSLVIAMYGATICKVGILGISTTTNQACCVLAKPISFDINFLFWWFVGNKDYVLSLAYGGGQPNISQELIRSLRLPCPSLQVQKQIVEKIQIETTRIDDIISKIEDEMCLVQEYRATLISECVTGQRKVTS